MGQICVESIARVVFDADINELGVRHFSRFSRSGRRTVRDFAHEPSATPLEKQKPRWSGGAQTKLPVGTLPFKHYYYSHCCPVKTRTESVG